MHDYAQELWLSSGVLAVKFSVAALIVDERDRILVCKHATRDGESLNDAAGSVTETLRYVKDSPTLTETALEGLARCLKEEHGLSAENIREAELELASANSYFMGEWPVGVLNGTLSTYPAVNMLLRTKNPDYFMQENGRVSEEINANDFMSLYKAKSIQPKRPGYRQWLEAMTPLVEAARLPKSIPIDWPVILPKTGEDARYPYIED